MLSKTTISDKILPGRQSQVIMQSIQLYDAGGGLVGNSFTAPQNIVEVKIPEGFKVTRVTFQHTTPGPTTDNSPPYWYVTINSRMPATQGDGYNLYSNVFIELLTNTTTVYQPTSEISFENFADIPLQGNFYISASISGATYTWVTIIWQGYYE